MARADEGPLSYFFADAPADSPLSYQALQTRRKIAEAMLGARSRFPKDIGEGLTYLGEKIAQRRMLEDLDQRAAAQDAFESKFFANSPGNVRPAGLPTGTSPAVPIGTTPLVASSGGINTAPPTMVNEGDYNYLDAAADAGGFGPRFRTENNQEVGSRVGFGNAVSGIAPEMQAKLQAAYNVMPDELKPSFVINEGARTPEYQKYLYDTRQGRGMVAPPGTSRHEFGQAVDVDRGPALDWLQKNATQFGLTGIPGDYPHIQSGVATGRNALAQAMMPPATLPVPPTAMPREAPPVVTDIKPMPEFDPQGKIEPYTPQVFPDPGKQPQRLPPPPETQQSSYLRQVIGNSRFSPEAQERAKEIVKKEDAARNLIQEQQEHDYRTLYTKWQQDVAAKEKGEREEPIRKLEYTKNALAIRAAQAVDDTVRNKALADLAKVNVEIANEQRKLGEYRYTEVGGRRYEQKVDEQGRPIGEYQRSPGVPPEEEKQPTEVAARNIQFLIRTQRDLDAVDHNMEYGKALTDPVQAGLDKVTPHGMRGMILSDKYLNASDALGNWGAAFLNATSGATVTPSEARTQLPAFMPAAGDSDERLQIKAQRRRDEMEAIKAGGGKITRDAVLASNERYMRQDKAADSNAAAAEWLAKNPTHPKAEAVRRKLMGEAP
jgi:hypothetical protein